MIIGAVFIGLFSLLAGAVGGTIFGARTALKADNPPIEIAQLDKSGRDVSTGLINQLSEELKQCRTSNVKPVQ